MIKPPDDAKYLPEDYQDEMPPASRPSPNDWIKRLPGDVFALVGLDEAMGNKPDDSAARILTDGDIVLFDWSRGHGNAELTIRVDGTWSVSRDMPTGGENELMMVAFVGEWESVSMSIDELVENAAGYRGATGEAEESDTIHYYSWSENGVPFEFRAGEFHQIEAA